MIEKYGFQKQNINNEEIPTLTDGFMMLVSDDGENWYKREVLCKFKSIYIAVDSRNNEITIQWRYAKTIQTKEEQLTAILGSSDKVAEIMELFKNE